MKYHWITIMQDTGHPGITPGCIFPCFLPENVPLMHFVTLMHPMMSSLQKRCHLVVGHTLRYTVSKNEAN